MKSFRQWNLRAKFMAVSILSGLVPLLLYACFPLRNILVSVREIEDSLLQEELLEAEALLQNEIRSLERETARYAERVQRLPAGLRVPLEPPLDVDFAVLRSGEGDLHPLVSLAPDLEIDELGRFLSETGDELSSIGSITGSTSDSMTGFVDLRGAPHLVSVARLNDRNELLTLGLDVEHGLAPSLSDLTRNEIRLTWLKSGEGDLPNTIDHSNPEVLSISKTLRGIDGKSRILLQVGIRRGLFSRIETDPLWTFLLFVVGLYLATMIATAWAASLVLEPLKQFIGTMGTISDPSTYPTRVEVDREDVIGDVKKNFNELMARLEYAQRRYEEAQESLVEAQKVETAHAIVITLAHEINNPLTYTLGQAELLLMDESLSQESRRSIEVIRAMSLRIKEVVGKLVEMEETHLTPYPGQRMMVAVDRASVE